MNENVKAILIGITDYSAYENTPDLPMSLKDVDLMGEALVQGLKIHPLHIWVQSFDRGYLTRSTFLKGIRLFLQDLNEDDVVLFYFSGHGTIHAGKHYLLFSDGPLETQSLLDLFAQFRAEKRVLFLDCCMSGEFALSDRNVQKDILGAEDYLGGGIAVFASGRKDEPAGYSDEIPASLFTMFLYNAMTNRYCVQDGHISLDTIFRLVRREADAWNEGHPDRQQHPVFRSNMTGTVFFTVSERCENAVRLPEREDYMIAAIAPLHSQIAKRYVVKVILKCTVTEKALIRINREIVRSVRGLDLFKSDGEKKRRGGLPVNVVFTYYGYSHEDVAEGRYAFRTTWVDGSQDREHWYRTNSHSKVAGNILIDKNPSYSFLRRLSEDNTADTETVIRETGNILRRILIKGEKITQTFEEYENGELAFVQMKESMTDICREIDALYMDMSDLPVPPAKLTKWSLLAANIAGSIQDFSVFLQTTGIDSESNRYTDQCECEDERIRRFADLMEVAIGRFHRDLEALRIEEKALI